MNLPRMSPEREKKLRSLAELMNTRHRIPFPINKPLLACFDVALTEEENDFLLCMETKTHTYHQAAALSGRPEDRFRPLFDELVKKGFIWPQGPAGSEGYSLAGIMVGWFEIYLSSGDESPERQEFARRVDLLFKSWGKTNFFPLRNLTNYWFQRNSKPWISVVSPKPVEQTARASTIAVDRTLQPPAMRIYPARSVHDLIDKYGAQGKIALVHCFCRQYHKMVQEPCRFALPAESCIVIGDTSRYAINYGIGRPISKDEAMALVRGLQEKGAVHQVFHHGEDLDQPELGICNCCWDCCGVLGSYNRGIVPLHLKSFFLAQLADSSRCNACNVCVDHCPVQAISLVEEKARIDGPKCIGCGQCELQCPEDAISLVPSERTVLLPLQKRSDARISW